VLTLADEALLRRAGYTPAPDGRTCFVPEKGHAVPVYRALAWARAEHGR
jgi:hypothetical protein